MLPGGTNDSQTTIKAAQYIRMSTDMQKYSTENQIAAIALYAAVRGIQIVTTYADPGKSGLTIKQRTGLQQLISDVRSPRPGFETVLVYDISRWGRFQDVDESAYYEFICREAGISVQYCAEEFENDGSLSSTILKAMKRAMAAEYSRELSTRVFIAKCQMTMRGFHTGGQPGYGLRRMLVDEYGNRKAVLHSGQWKFLHTDRTILTPGLPDELETVRWIFTQYVVEHRTISSIVSDLNARGIPSFGGRPWSKNNVRAVLANERYIGNNVFNRTSIRLKSKRVRVDQRQWVRARGVVEPTIEEELFSGAQARFSSNLHRISRFELLDHLTGLWCRHGTLSASLIVHSPTSPCPHTYRRLFGSLLEAFKLVGYRHRTRRPIYASVERRVANTIAASVRASGGVADVRRQERQTRILVNGETIISILLAHSCYATSNGKPRWILRHSASHRSDIAVLATFDEKRHCVVDYYIMPGFLLTNPQQLLFDTNPIDFEAFRSATLVPLDRLLRRDSAPSDNICVPNIVSAAQSIPSKTLHFRKDGRPAGSRRVLRGFELRSQRMASFLSTCKGFIRSQHALDRDLISLLQDVEFRELLKSEKLLAMPSLLREHLSSKSETTDRDGDARNNTVQQRLDLGKQLGPASRRLRPERLRQIGQMRMAFADFSPVFVQLLVAASMPKEFIANAPRSRIMSQKEIAQVLCRFRPLENAVRPILPEYAKQAYCFALTRAYFRGLLKNEHVVGYIRAIHPTIHRRLRAVSFTA